MPMNARLLRPVAAGGGAMMAPITPTAVLLTSGTTYTVPAGATTMKAWAVGPGGQADGWFANAGGAGGCAYKTWSISGGNTVAYSVGAPGQNTTVTFSGTTITGNGAPHLVYRGSPTGGSFSGGDGGAQGGSGVVLSYFQYGGAVGGNGTRQSPCNRTPATDVSGLFAALALAGVATSETCAATAAFGSGGKDEKFGPTSTAGLGGGGVLANGYVSLAGTAPGNGAVILYFA